MEESLSITLAGQLWAEVGNSFVWQLGSVACSVLHEERMYMYTVRTMKASFVKLLIRSWWHMTGDETEHAQLLPCTVLHGDDLYGNVCFVHFNVVARARNLRVPEPAIQ